MKVNEKIIEMINIWNQISNYKFTYELIDSRLYIKNEVTDKAVTELYGMLSIMLQKAICSITNNDHELTLEVWEI